MPSGPESRRGNHRSSASGDLVSCYDVERASWYRVIAPHLPVLALTAAVGMCEMISALLMFVYSGIYAAIADKSSERFVRVICLSLLLAALQALAEATKIYCRDFLALTWRKELTQELEGAVKKTLRLAGHQPTRLLPPADQLRVPDLCAGLATQLGDVPNLDQRVSQDVAELCDAAAKIVAAVVVLPAVVVFYTCYLSASIGPLSPFLCFLYFLLSIAVSYPIAQRVSPVVYAQGRLEGDFRLQWTRVLAQWPAIVLWQGGASEVHASAALFQQLWHNQRVLLRRQWQLNTATQGFQYAGSIVTYAIVGVSIIYLQGASFRHDADADADGGNETQWSTTVVRWTRGTYAAMALIHAFTTVTDALGWWSTATGLANRALAVLLAARPAATSEPQSHSPPRGWWGTSQAAAAPLYDPLTTREPTDGAADAVEATVAERSPLERRRQRDPWGLWTLLREVQRSRAIRARLEAASLPPAADDGHRRSGRSFDGGGGGGGASIQLPRWTADRDSSPQPQPRVEPPDAVERGYAALFREQFERSPLRSAAGDSDDDDDDSDRDDDDGNSDDDGDDVAATLAAVEARVAASAAAPCDWFHVRNWSLYSAAAADADGAADGAPLSPRRLLLRDASFSVTSATRLLVSGPTGCGKSTLLFALTQQLRASRGAASAASLFPHLQWPPSGAPRRLRVLHCPQTPYVLPEVRRPSASPVCLSVSHCVSLCLTVCVSPRRRRRWSPTCSTRSGCARRRRRGSAVCSA